MTKQWLRPYPPGRGRWVIIAWELISLAAFGWSTVRLFDLPAAAAWVLGPALTALWLVGSWRIMRMGLYVSGYGVRLRGLLSTRTLAWSEIDRIVVDRAVRRLGAWHIPHGSTVLIQCGNGRTVNTALWAQGVDFHARPGLFEQVYRDLRERHAAALATAGGPARTLRYA